jgi:hypothetical protein
MKKYLLYTGLVLIILSLNSFCSVSALPDGYYFSNDLKEGDLYEWNVVSLIENYNEINDSTLLNKGSTISVEILQNPTNIEYYDFGTDRFDYFKLKFDNVVIESMFELWELIKTTRYFVSDVEINYFDHISYVTDGDEAYFLVETTSGDDSTKIEYRYNKNSGILNLKHTKEVVDGVVKNEYKVERIGSDGGLFGLDFSPFWIILPALMIPLIIRKRK